MVVRYRIEDDLHAEVISEHETFRDAVVALEALATAPWDAAPNRPPCQGWAKCGRRYEVVECEAEVHRVLRRVSALEVNAGGAVWDPRLADRGQAPSATAVRTRGIRKRLLLPAALGIAALALSHRAEYVSDTTHEGCFQVTWLLLVALAAGLSGYLDPSLGWRAGAAVIAVQPFCVLFLALVSGEVTHPSSSMGGLVGVCIGSTLMFLFSPVPMLAGQLGSWLRSRRNARHASRSRLPQ